MRTWLVEVGLGWNDTVMNREHGLDQTRDAAGCFQVADVGFDRSDQQRLIGFTAFTVDFRRRTEFHWIAIFGSRSVSFKVLNLRSRNARVG